VGTGFSCPSGAPWAAGSLARRLRRAGGATEALLASPGPSRPPGRGATAVGGRWSPSCRDRPAPARRSQWCGVGASISVTWLQWYPS